MSISDQTLYLLSASIQSQASYQLAVKYLRAVIVGNLSYDQAHRILASCSDVYADSLLHFNNRAQDEVIDKVAHSAPEGAGAFYAKARRYFFIIHSLWLNKNAWSDGTFRETDFSYLDLSGLELKSVDLSDANLSYADLSNVGFFGADLSHADLTGADLSNQSSICSSNLSHANLSHVNLSRARLYKSNLSHANLSHVNFTDAELMDVDFESSTLTDCTFNNTTLSFCDFRRSCLMSADFSPIKSLKGCYFFSTDLSFADLSGIDLSSSFFDEKTDLYRSDIESTRLPCDEEILTSLFVCSHSMSDESTTKLGAELLMDAPEEETGDMYMLLFEAVEQGKSNDGQNFFEKV